MKNSFEPRLTLTCNAEMQVYGAMYTSDKHKKNNKRWLEGRLEYNLETSVVYLYDEEDQQLAKYSAQCICMYL